MHRPRRIARLMRLVPRAAPLLVAAGGASAPSPSPDGPPPSAGHSLVFHDGLGSVLLVNAGLGARARPPWDTRTVLWRWSGEAWSVLDSLGPPIRNLAGVAYDRRRDVLVLFGGTFESGRSYGDTWEWSRGSGWRQHDVAGPGVRDHTDMAYDDAGGRVLLFGGQTRPDGSFPADTWSWDGTSWTRVATEGPRGRGHHSMIHDPRSNRVLLFGGSAPTTGRLGDTWAWNDSAWRPAAPDIVPRSHARLGVTSSGVILFGGFSRAPSTPMLRLSGDGWVDVAPAEAPSARYLTAMAFDPRRGVTVLYGGGWGSDLFADTWEHDAAGGWRRVR